jgi:hypothetical protein
MMECFQKIFFYDDDDDELLDGKKVVEIVEVF